MLTRFAKLAGPSSTGKTDASTFSSWAADGITFVSGLVDSTNGSAVMGGASASEFSPRGTFTREQAITTTLRLANILEIQ